MRPSRTAPAALRWRRRALTLLAGAAVALPGATAAVTPAQASPTVAATATHTAAAVATAKAAGPDRRHPFSDPSWFPLRRPAKVSCIKGNPGCRHPEYHHYWAIDLDSPHRHGGAPVYAAGAGILHVGSRDPKCVAHGRATAGTWVWVDHGSGVVTKYEHLASISVKNGSYVTPATKIGTMGHSGDVTPCRLAYLDFQIRHHGINGPTVPFPTLHACRHGERLDYPKQMPGHHKYWNKIPYLKVLTPKSTNGCLPSSSPATPSRPQGVAGAYGNEAAVVSWDRPSSADHVHSISVTTEEFHPSVGKHGRYGAPTYERYPSDTHAAAYRGLLNGRPYKFQVTFHNSAGSSRNSPWVVVVPKATPLAPSGLRKPTVREFHGFKVYWERSRRRGTDVTGYQVALRRKKHVGYTPWVQKTIDPELVHHDWHDLPSHTRYEVRIRATSAIGDSPWFGPIKVKTRG